MKPKFKIIKCTQDSDSWFEVEEKGWLWGYNKVKTVIPGTLYAEITKIFDSYEDAKKYVEENIPTDSKESKIYRQLYENIF